MKSFGTLIVVLVLLAASWPAATYAAELTVAVPVHPAHPYERVDLIVNGVPEVARPGDPAQIMVDMELATPSGTTVRVPGFAMRRTEAKTVDGRVRFVPMGQWQWYVRYVPSEPGEHHGAVVVSMPSGTSRSQSFHFAVTPSEKSRRGMVRLAKDNPQAFAYDDGSAYIPVGQNIGWWYRRASPAVYERGVEDVRPEKRSVDPRLIYRRRLDDLAANGGNWIRIFLNVPWSLAIESGQPYVYDEDGGCLLDAIVDMCEVRGIAIQVCIEYMRGVDCYPPTTAEKENWCSRGDNPYHRGNGGPCLTTDDFIAMPQARAQWKAQLRYLIARYGSSPSIFAWELWNEINCFPVSDRKAMVAWIDEMARYARQNDPYRHLVTCSLGSATVWPDLWSLPSMDVVQYHEYGHADLPSRPLPTLPGQAWNPQASQVEICAPEIQAVIGQFPAKPTLFAEVGVCDRGFGVCPYLDGERVPDVPKDRRGYAFHESLWTPFFAGAAGGGMNWFWDFVVESFDLYGQYRPLVDFLADIPLQKSPMPSMTAKSSAVYLTCLARGNRWGTVAWVWDSRANWRKVVLEKKEPQLVSGATLTLPISEKGTFVVTCIDPWTGKTLDARTLDLKADTITLPLPDFTVDVGVKAVRKE